MAANQMDAVCQGYSRHFWFQTSHKYSVDDEEEFKVVDMTRKGRRGHCHTRTDELTNMYPAGRSISAA